MFSTPVDAGLSQMRSRDASLHPYDTPAHRGLARSPHDTTNPAVVCRRTIKELLATCLGLGQAGGGAISRSVLRRLTDWRQA